MLTINPHPPLVAFPFVLVSLLVVFEICAIFRPQSFWNKMAITILILAALFSVLAFLSGYQASELAGVLSARKQSLIENHHQWGKVLLFTLLPATVIRIIANSATHGRKVFFMTYYLLILASLTTVLYTGYLGGRLVFIEGVGVALPNKV